MWLHVVSLKYTYVSGVRTASMIRATSLTYGLDDEALQIVEMPICIYESTRRYISEGYRLYENDNCNFLPV
jgi:hypothetical protein